MRPVLPEERAEVRGARDLVALWRRLPAAVLRYPMRKLPEELGLAALCNELRACAWRERCAAAQAPACADVPQRCAQADRGICRADVLFPASVGGGALAWRMATLFPQWRPRVGELRLVALGEVACDELRWASARLAAWSGLRRAGRAAAQCFADLELTGATRWRVEVVTPWVVDKARGARSPVAGKCLSRDDVAHELRKSMAARAHKLTALCARDPLLQRIGGHLARYASEPLLAREFGVVEAEVEPLRLPGEHLGRRGKPYDVLAWTGAVVVEASDAALPWLTLLDLCGGGENADKGFGSVEIRPCADS